MIIRNSILTTLRAKGKTLLFFVLILLLTLCLTLGLGMYVYSFSTLSIMDEQYTSIALVEYMGEDYPDKDTADSKARVAQEQINPADICKVNGVLSWEPADETLAALDGYQRLDGIIPYEGWAVLEVSGFYPVSSNSENTVYSSRIINTLYTQEDHGTMLLVDAGDTGFEPETNASYLLHGRFYDSGTGNPTFSLVSFDTGEAAFYKLNGEDDPSLSDSIFTKKAHYYESANNYVRITASDTLKALEEFQQGILTLSQGRFPESGETGVCVVDGQMANQMKLSLGDEISLSLFNSNEDDRFLFSDDTDEKKLTVVGITSANEEWAGNIWVSEGEGHFQQPLFGFRLGVAVLDNTLARKASDELSMLMPDGLQVTLYDQGYFTAAQPIEAMETTALAVAGATLCTSLTVLILFGNLFVGRQKETVSVLRSLGTPPWKIRLWLLSGGGIISATATFMGALLGQALMETIIRLTLEAVQNLYTVDQRYSESTVGTIISPLMNVSISPWPAIISGIAVFLAALISCILFLSQALRQSVPKSGREKVKIPHGKTSIHGHGILRYSFIFATRSGGRSIIVIVASMIFTLFLGILLTMSQNWKEQITQLYDTTKIQGRVTSTNGRMYSDLLISGDNLRLLWKSGQLDNISVSVGWHYWFDDETPIDGNINFSNESHNNWISRQPQLTAINAFSAAKSFYYEETVDIEWVNGWNESYFFDNTYYPVFKNRSYWSEDEFVQNEVYPPYPCIVSEDFINKKNLKLGDTFTICAKIPELDNFSSVQIQLTAVGTFNLKGENDIYVPLSFWTLPSTLIGEDGSLPNGDPLPAYSDSSMDEYTYYFMETNYSSCRFTLSSARKIDDFRDYLASNGVSQAGKLGSNRLTVVLEDQTFIETAGSLERLISFCNIILPALFAALCLLGFVISWLVTGSRRMEFAILQGLGTQRTQVFFIFFLEQAIMCLLGSCLGGIVLIITGSGSSSITALFIFLLCYLAGCTFSIFLVGRTKLINLLSEKE